MLSLMSGQNKFWIEIGKAKMKEEKKKLVGARPSDPILSMLADRVVMTWLRLQDAELQLSVDNSKQKTLRQRAALESTLARCQQNYISAIDCMERYKNRKEGLKKLREFRRSVLRTRKRSKGKGSLGQKKTEAIPDQKPSPTDQSKSESE